MSSWATIAIENEDKSVDFTKCRHDGFRLGQLLLEYYSSRSKINDLILKGEIWSLEKNIDPDESKEHLLTGEGGLMDFSKRQKDVTLFTYRDWDRNRKDFNPLWTPTWEECRPGYCANSLLFRNDFKCGFTYLYDMHNIWWIADETKKWTKLEDYLYKKELLEWFIEEFKTLPELDVDIPVKEAFFEYVFSGTDLEYVRGYLYSFPYAICEYFDTLEDLKTFVADTFKEKYSRYLKDNKGPISLKDIILILEDEDCLIVGNLEYPESGFLFCDFKKNN